MAADPQVVVIGSGVMGRGIANSFARAGTEVAVLRRMRDSRKTLLSSPLAARRGLFNSS